MSAPDKINLQIEAVREILRDYKAEINIAEIVREYMNFPYIGKYLFLNDQNKNLVRDGYLHISTDTLFITSDIDRLILTGYVKNVVIESNINYLECQRSVSIRGVECHDIKELICPEALMVMLRPNGMTKLYCPRATHIYCCYNRYNLNEDDFIRHFETEPNKLYEKNKIRLFPDTEITCMPGITIEPVRLNYMRAW